MRAALALAVVAFGVTACGDFAAPAGPGETPHAFRGVWGADCDRPFMQIEAKRIRVFADPIAHDLASAALTGDALEVKYITPEGEVSETYAKAGDALRLVAGTYGAARGKAGVTVTWNKAPMKRCPAGAAPTV